MALTYAEILTRIQSVLWTTVNTDFTAALIGTYTGAILKEMSQQVPIPTSQRHPLDRPVPIRGSYTTDGTTRDIVLTDWDFDDLVRISQFDGVEHPVDKSPKRHRNFNQQGKIVSLLLNSIPAASESVYIYPKRDHILQQAIGTTDTEGAVKTAAAIAATSLALKSLGTGTVNKYTKLTIAGDTTEYMVIATATITSNEATVSITPALVVAGDVDDVVTLALADSTLSPGLEEVLINWTSGAMIKDYSINVILNPPISTSWEGWTRKGQEMIDKAKADLERMVIAERYAQHPRG